MDNYLTRIKITLIEQFEKFEDKFFYKYYVIVTIFKKCLFENIFFCKKNIS